MNCLSVTIQMEVLQQYFFVMLFVLHHMYLSQQTSEILFSIKAPASKMISYS